MRNDIITRVETTLTPDGQGGYTEETVETGSFDVKLSIGSNIEEATAYGVSIEQILKVVADVPLMENEASLYIVKGETGPIGPQGLQGEVGPAGPQGETGPQGPIGPEGPKGADGTMTFEDLTPEQKASLKGDKGDKGDTGAAGPQGEPGPKGEKGDTGAAFTYDMFTEEQLAALTGPEGPQGPQGEKGDIPVIIGSAGPNVNVVGVPTISTTTDGDRVTFIFNNLKGEQGIQGEVGPQGIQGEQGPAGADGTTPVKGTDYWTAVDKQEIINEVLAAIPSSEGVEY